MRFAKEPYIKINLALAGVIILIMIYSAVFSPEKNNYPVVCIHEKLTGEPCVSCGLSHSFSLILRGRFDEAGEWNVYGMRVFLFFFLQFFMRIAFSLVFLKKPGLHNYLIMMDIIGSIFLFLISFRQFFSYLAHFS